MGQTDPMKRLMLAALVASLIVVVVSPPSAGAVPGLKVTHECESQRAVGIGRARQAFFEDLRANETTACSVAERAIHHGNVSSGPFHTEGWQCKLQRYSEPGGGYVKCRRGTDEAFEFRWALTQ
jgi:hypothetical protein